MREAACLERPVGPGWLCIATTYVLCASGVLEHVPSAALPAFGQAGTQLEKLLEEGPILDGKEAPSHLPPSLELQAQQSWGDEE